MKMLGSWGDKTPDLRSHVCDTNPLPSSLVNQMFDPGLIAKDFFSSDLWSIDPSKKLINLISLFRGWIVLKTVIFQNGCSKWEKWYILCSAGSVVAKCSAIVLQNVPVGAFCNTIALY